MSRDTTTIMGVFNTEEEALSAMKEAEAQGWTVRDIHSPIPSEKITEAFKLKKSKVGWFTLVGGMTGFVSGFSLAIFSATRWSLIVSGKPIISWIPFFVIAFEFTILFAVFGNVLGLVSQVGFPAKQEEHYHPACSGSAYGLSVESPLSEVETLKGFFQNKGATTS